MVSVLVSLTLKDEMRLVVYFDSVKEGYDEEEMLKQAIERMEDNGINRDLVEFWETETY